MCTTNAETQPPTIDQLRTASYEEGWARGKAQAKEDALYDQKRIDEEQANRRLNRRFFVYFMAYIVVGVMTFSSIYEEWGDPGQPPGNIDRLIGSVFGGAAWPIYWTGRAGLNIHRRSFKPQTGATP